MAANYRDGKTHRKRDRKLDRQMEQVASQQALHTVMSPHITHHKAPSCFLPSFIKTGSLTDLVTTSNRKTFLFKESFSAAFVCSSLQRINPNMGEPCQKTSRHFSCHWCTIWLQKNSLITITISDQNSEAALRRSWRILQRWQNKGRQQGGAKKGLKSIFLPHYYCCTVEKNAADGVDAHLIKLRGVV